MSLLPKSTHGFDDYQFGEQIDRPSNAGRSPISPMNTQRPALEPNSPLRIITEHIQPLTADVLDKKNRMDSLLRDRPIPGVRTIKRRRSISNGNIYRHRYNDDNKPMTLAIADSKPSSSIKSDISLLNSPHSQYDTRTPRHPTRHFGTPRPSYGTTTNKKQLTDSRSVITSCGLRTSTEQHNPTGPPRRFSSLVRLSAAHISMKRTQKHNRSQHYRPALFYRVYQKLSAVALRVADNRTCELSDTRVSVEELISLCRYLCVLKSPLYNNKKENDHNLQDPQSPLNLHPLFELVSPTDDTVNSSPPNSPPRKKRRHWNNIIRFTRHDSRSTNETNPLLSSSHASMTYQSIPPSSSAPQLPRKSNFEKAHTCLKHLFHSFAQPNSEQEQSTQIFFEGWSLCIFPPKSLLRLYLWQIVGSKPFKTFIFILLLSQWALLSLAPIRFNADQAVFSRFGDYLLLVINISYTFELMAKIIIYGFVLNMHSKTRPSLQSFIHYLKQQYSIDSIRLPEVDIESISSQQDQETESNYTPHRQKLRASANPLQPTSSNASTRSSVRHSPCHGSNNSHHSNPLSTTSTAGEPAHWRHSSLLDQDFGSLHSGSLVGQTLPVAEHPVIEDMEDVDLLKIKHGSFLSSLPNVIDLIAVASYWIDVVMLLYFHKQPWPVLQAFAAARLLRLLVLTEGTTVIMTSLSSCFDILKNVMGFFLFFWILFSLAALLIFMNAFSRRCAILSTEEGVMEWNYVEPRISCNGYMTSATTFQGALDIKTGHHAQIGVDGQYCQLGRICIQDTNNQPQFGYVSYENILFAMLNIMTVISIEDWTDLLYISQDSVSNVGAAIFYCACIYLMTFIVVPMFIAVITTSFAQVRDDMRKSAFSSSNRKKRVLLTPGNRHQKKAGEEEWVYGGLSTLYHARNKFQYWSHYITSHAWFPYAGSMVVVGSVVSMMFYHSNLSNNEKIWLGYTSKLFTFIFAIEILFRIYGCLHWLQFWRRARNRTDLVIALVTVIDEIPFVKNSHYHVYLIIFSILRSYRIAYLFPGALGLLSDIIGDGQGIINLTFFTFLVLFLLAPISVQLFGGDFSFVDDDEPSMRFDNFYQAFLALFQIMTGENWTDILYSAMHSQEHASVTYAALFIVFLYFTIHYIVLNLFIAVIMENFDLGEEEIKQIQIKKYIREYRWKPEYFKMDSVSRVLLPFLVLQDKKMIDCNGIPKSLVAHVTSSKFKEFLVEDNDEDISPAHNPMTAPGHRQRYPPSVRSQTSAVTGRRGSISSLYSNQSLPHDEAPIFSNKESAIKYGDEYELNVARENKAVIVENLNAFRSVFLLKKDNLFRKLCTHLSISKIYNDVVAISILTSTLLALWSDQLKRQEHPWLTNTVMEPFHAALLLISWFDVFVHMIADGIFMLPKSYLRKTWNVFDMVNIGLQTGLMVMEATSATMLHASSAGYLRILRVLRSIRIAYYVRGMRAILLDLLYGLPKMMNAVALNLLVFVPFAIYGCYLFSGRFFLCNDDSATSREACFGEFVSSDDENQGILLPKVWKNPYDYSFDTFGESLLHLFECASGEGWILSLFSAMSIVSNDGNTQPQFSWSSLAIVHSLYYVVFMFVASICSIQLFIGVFLEIFKQRSGISTLTNTQRIFQDLQRQLALIKPSLKATRPADGTIRARFYDLVIDKRGKFAQFMAAVIMANIVVFATEHLHQPQWLNVLQNILIALFLCLYVFEMVAKIVGLGFLKWASSIWNIYDFIFVGAAILTSIPKFFMELTFEWDVARKLFLVGIAFRLAQRNESLDTLFRSVKRALPSIFYVSTVFGIVIICFGVIFQEHFWSTKYGPYGNEHANFRSLFTTVLTLFRVTTGENWDFLMHDFTVVPPDCVGEDDCGRPTYAIFLFVFFYIICTFIFVNLFTVIVIDNFSFTFDKRNQFTLITRKDLRLFKIAWSAMDPKASGYISIEQVPKFLRQLKGVLSVRVYDKEHSLATLLDASKHIDADIRHLIVVPLSETKTQGSFMNTNMIRERFFNIHEVNKRLSSIDPAVIKERKRVFNEAYQEIINSATYRGVAFHVVLEILALRLVDISKSLTFNELVNRARIKDNVEKALAEERARSLVSMLIERRNFLKRRRKDKTSQFMRRREKSLNVVGNWLMPTSASSYISPSSKDVANPFNIQLGLPPNPPPKKQGQEDNTEFSLQVTDVPRIVIDQALASPHQQTPLIPDPSSNSGNGNRRKSVPAITPMTLGAPSFSRPRSIYSLNNSSQPAKNVVRRASSPSIRLSSQRDISFRLNGPSSKEKILKKENVEEDTFIQYYAIERPMEKMTDNDADRIVSKFQDSTWSNLLKQAGDSSNEETEDFIDLYK